MPELFRAKVRKVGTSLGILIPKEVIEKQKIKEGEEVEVGLLKQRKLEEVLRLIGTAKGTKPFERGRIDRVDRW
jgi:hypothetical protein